MDKETEISANLHVCGRRRTSFSLFQYFPSNKRDTAVTLKVMFFWHFLSNKRRYDRNLQQQPTFDQHWRRLHPPSCRSSADWESTWAIYRLHSDVTTGTQLAVQRRPSTDSNVKQHYIKYKSLSINKLQNDVIHDSVGFQNLKNPKYTFLNFI